MSEPTPATPEVLRAPPRPWLRRLWVRVALVLLLICATCAVSWWLPRRTMVAVWWVGGHVSCEADDVRARAILKWFDPAQVRGLWNYRKSVHWVVGWVSEDREITGVTLKDSNVGDEWLRTLRRCPQLTQVVLHDRQLGPGLDHLRDCAKFNSLSITSAANRHLAEMWRLKQVEEVLLNEPQSGDLGLDALTALPKLKWLIVANCQSTSEILAAMPELPQLEGLGIRACTGFVDDDLRHLQRLRNLRGIDINGQTPLGDVALKHLSQLECLVGLGLRSPWQSVTQDGLRALNQMRCHKLVSVEKSQCTPAQLQMLRDQLPNCSIIVQ